MGEIWLMPDNQNHAWEEIRNLTKVEETKNSKEEKEVVRECEPPDVGMKSTPLEVVQDFDRLDSGDTSVSPKFACEHCGSGMYPSLT